jgi:hypothetical protein
MSRVYLLVRAQCTQASLPSTRNPVSSNPATSLAAIRSRTRSRKPSSRPGGPAGDGGDRAGGDRDAEQLAQCLRGPLLGQELADVDDDRGGPWDHVTEEGRGLGLVSLIADRWGHSEDTDGRSVFFELC